MKTDWTQRKEKWAAKMAGKPKSTTVSTDRLPPGQHLAKDWPVLDLGIHPDIPLTDWKLQLHGHVENPSEWTWEQFLALPQMEDTSDMHCVTTWTHYDIPWKGVSFLALLDIVHPKPEAKHLYIKCYDGYTTNIELEACIDTDVLIAHQAHGAPLAKEHGGPARLVIPKRYAWKGAKFIREIIFLDRALMGYWELRNYSMTAHPWTEDRFQ